MVEILIDFTVSFLVAIYLLGLADLTQFSWRYIRSHRAPWPAFVLACTMNLFWPIGVAVLAISRAIGK